MALVSGELPPRRSREVRNHLDDCDACRELVAHTAHALIPTVDEGPKGNPALEATVPSAASPGATDHPGSLGRGSMIGRYCIRRRLGAGAMGVVYAAEHLDLRRPVALKVVRADPNGDSDEQQLRARLLREARAASAVRHPHVVAVHDVLELEDGSPVMVMDLLAGESLRERLDRGRLGVGEARTLADQLLSALEAAHAEGVIHRDLKPDNVFLSVTPDGGLDARVLDFGIAKLTALDGPAAQTAGLTMTGMMVGTPHYMAPEQAFAEPDLDARVDLWAVGVIVYEALAGTRPVDGENLGQLFRRLATMSIAPLADTAPEIPPAFADWIHRLLVERERRLADAATARRALDEAFRRRPRSDDSVAPVALGSAALDAVALDDSADGIVAPSVDRPRRASWPLVIAAVAAVTSVVGLSSLRASEPTETLTTGLAPGAGALPILEIPNRPPPPHALTSAEPISPDEPRASAPAVPAKTMAPASRPSPRPKPTAEPSTPEPDEPEPTPSASTGLDKLLKKPPF